jgi:hypothetical protein
MIPGDLHEKRKRFEDFLFVSPVAARADHHRAHGTKPTTGKLASFSAQGGRQLGSLSSTVAELKLTKYSGVAIANQVVYTGRTPRLAPSPA